MNHSLDNFTSPRATAPSAEFADDTAASLAITTAAITAEPPRVILFGRDSGWVSVGTSDHVKVQLAADIHPEDVLLRADENDNLLLSIPGSTARLGARRFSIPVGNNDERSVQAIEFADGTRWVLADIQREILRPTAGNDTIYADHINSWLQGGAGNDRLIGGSGADTLDGGAGDDTLMGCRLYTTRGRNTYVFGNGSGHDVVPRSTDSFNGITDPAWADVVQLKSDIRPSDVTLSAGGRTVTLSLNGGVDTLVLEDYYSIAAVNQAGASYAVIRFADGTQWDYAEMNRLLTQGTSGNDTIHGTYGSNLMQGGDGDDLLLTSTLSSEDTMYGGAGNDTLTSDGSIFVLEMHGDAGNDRIQGGAMADLLTGDEGNDTVFGGEGHDLILGGLGHDSLTGEAGNDTLMGGAQNDSLFGGQGDDLLRGEDGNDLLHGNAGNDTLDGGSGYNTYVFGKGSGQDTIDTATGQNDVLRLEAGVQPGEVKLRRVGDDLSLTIQGSSGDSLRVSNFFLNEATSGHELRAIQFADGTSWGLNTLKAMVLSASAGADTLTGYASNERINGLAGNDLIRGRNGHDLLEGGAGQDSLYGDGGNDSLYGGAGHDLLKGGDGSDRLSGGDGDDTLSGGSGSDTLYGGAGADTYVFGHDRGQDLIASTGAAPGSGGRADTVRLDGGVKLSEVSLQREVGSNDLLLTVAGGSNGVDSLRIADYFNGNSQGLQYAAIEFNREPQTWDFAEVVRRLGGAGSTAPVAQP